MRLAYCQTSGEKYLLLIPDTLPVWANIPGDPSLSAQRRSGDTRHYEPKSDDNPSDYVSGQRRIQLCCDHYTRN